MMNNISKQLMKRQLVDQVIEYLKTAIASGDYGMGAKLPAEPKLVEELGVGRSTLREAIRVLAYSGMLEVRQGDGTYVRALPANSEPLAYRLRRAKVREVLEVRRALEFEIVRLATERRRKKDLEQIRRHLKERHKALLRKDIPTALDADISFHCAIAGAAGNEVLADVYRTFALSLRKALETVWDGADTNPNDIEELHNQLLKAIEARDVTQAMSTITALLDRHNSALLASPP